MCALAAVILGILPCLPGLLASVGVLSSSGPVFGSLYDCAWFVGVAVSSAAYWLMMTAGSRPAAAGAASLG